MAASEEPAHITADANTLSTVLRGAALAAGLLEKVCEPASDDTLRGKVVRELARDLRKELEALVEQARYAKAAGVAVVEGALRAADVANLAASEIPELPRELVPEATAAVHLSAGTARALGALTGNVANGLPEAELAQNTLKDVRGAVWRARLAARQADEFLEEMG